MSRHTCPACLDTSHFAVAANGTLTPQGTTPLPPGASAAGIVVN